MKNAARAIVLSSREDIQATNGNPDGQIQACCLTSRVEDAKLRFKCVDTPFAHGAPHCWTGLNRETVAVLQWLVWVRRRDILRQSGTVPAGKLYDVVTGIRKLAEDDQQDDE